MWYVLIQVLEGNWIAISCETLKDAHNFASKNAEWAAEWRTHRVISQERLNELARRMPIEVKNSAI